MSRGKLERVSIDSGSHPESTLLRKASGNRSSSDPLVGFLYLLMRDHVPTGVVGDLLREVTKPVEWQFTNGFLEQYAEHVRNRLRQSKSPRQATQEAWSIKAQVLATLKGFMDHHGFNPSVHEVYEFGCKPVTPSVLWTEDNVDVAMTLLVLEGNLLFTEHENFAPVSRPSRKR